MGTDLVLVAIGGAGGCMARFLVSVWAARVVGTGFPVGTLIVNVLGSTLLTFVMVLSVEAEVVSPRVRVTLGPGFMGGFTTYSTFNYETLALVEQGAFLLATTNVLATLLGCFAGGWLGFVAGRLTVGP